MDVLHRGFDGLDVSFQGQISPELCAALDAAKAQAAEDKRDVLLEWNGAKMHVAETGARGGYAFRASTGPFGATWFFKKPNPRDPWGVRVSLNSLGLAVHGLGQARADLFAFLDALGIATRQQGVSIGRVDYAVDILAPDLILDPECFVMHSQSTRADHVEGADMQVHGRSGRVTSVTVGKMPGRQVIVYDKRAEVIAKGKAPWWTIWNAAREASGQSPLDLANVGRSRIWRVELRAGKKHLYDRWRIRTWADLDQRLGDVMARSLEAVRYCDACTDSNRARWPDTPLWQTVRRAVEGDLFELRAYADPDLVRAVYRQAQDQLLQGQMTGLLIGRAALHGQAFDDLPTFASEAGRDIGKMIRAEPERFEQKLGRAKGRYVFI